MHQDKELKMAAENFPLEPPYEALLSKEFERVIDCSSTLAHSTLQRWIAKLKFDMALNVLELPWNCSSIPRVVRKFLD
ncbi:hypothetical protein JTE90_026922 [Oedothorax gibbosus]|uniref:Transposase n=1 Tax=Oedothorax gibbosus TaxID=931172 RepID=A0AAV6TL68_9ARAC|nr:hypothetical protein JTE90_026922 [Oedothorax gibbosus]